MILVLGKTRSRKVPNLGCRGPESPGWFGVLPKKCAQDVMHERAICRVKAADHQCPIAAAFCIIQIVSAEEYSRLTQNFMQICCFTCSVILNVTATWYTYSLNGVSHPHSQVQWSRHCSRMHIPVHFSWLPNYIDVAQTILIILSMARLSRQTLCI